MTSRTVVILAANEERSLGRCLDSVLPAAADEVIVVDTGSTDRTTVIAEQYRHVGVRVVHEPWGDSFAAARNRALAHAAPGWVLFVDADEWFPERSAAQLPAVLDRLDDLDLDPDTVFAPTISEVDRPVHADDVPRLFRTSSGIRFRGAVHEYPVVDGSPPRAVRVAPIDLELLHDGYSYELVAARGKPERNRALLARERENDPMSPRWLYFTIRDNVGELTSAEMLTVCRHLHAATGAARDLSRADWVPPRSYYRAALRPACYSVIRHGDRNAMTKICDEIERTDGDPSPDAAYFRALADVFGGCVSGSTLRCVIQARRGPGGRSRSLLAADGEHLDAVLCEVLQRLYDTTEADHYRALCVPWSDAFFDRSRLTRRPGGPIWRDPAAGRAYDSSLPDPLP